MASKTVGLGSECLCTHLDESGTPLDGGETYKLTVPNGGPAKDFWSVVVYDAASRSMLETSQRQPTASTYTNPEVNADGSVDVYFGPKAPAGKERNWIETVPGKDWTMTFRLTGTKTECSLRSLDNEPNDVGSSARTRTQDIGYRSS